ncbi:exo-alpha-sialidase [Georgenia satyanarayanai]|uniref:discoidin domain-containing protein n=1 Tax=Georgenia satyanarayanai TaxID=860221 RepID=UPI00203F73DA|nr:discoidin domain-containing protein [Georgenia satyanarayanai]MCM3660959.1 exo-alpha-sialidase [Georgenia satyanarayanai]
MTRRRVAAGLAAVLTTGLLGVTPVHAAENARDYDAAWGGEPFYEEQQLATNGEGFANYRIAALAVANNGDVLASYDGRPTAADSPGPNSILQRRSTDDGETWGEQTVIAQGKEEAPIHGYSDPSYVVDRETGSIFNFHVYSLDRGFGNSQPGTDPEDRNVIHANVARSDDNGETWTHRTITADITTDVETWRSRFAASGQGIQLKYGPHAGRLIQQYTIVNTALNTYQAVSVYSDDHGETWQAGEPVGTGMDENKTVELSDGRVMLNSRDSQRSGFRKVAISEDGGHSYGEVTLDRELPDPANNASIVRAFPNAEQGSAEAKVLLFSNAASSSTRSNGTIRMSCDDGRTWPVARTFQPGGMAYSTLVTQPDGSIGLLYEPDAGYGGIRYAKLNLAWLGGVCAAVAADDVATGPGTTADVPVTVTNQTSEDLTGAALSLDLPEGWDEAGAEVPTVAAGASATVTVRVTVPDDAFAGQYPVDITLTTDQGTSSGSLTVTVDAAEGEVLTVVPSVTDASASGEYLPGERLSFAYRVTNISDEIVSVVPQSANLEGFNPPGAPNCRFQNLAPGTSYTCTTGYRTLTQDDLDAGSFTPQTSWTALRGSYSGPEIATLERNAPTVPVSAPENLLPQDQLTVADVSSEETTQAQTPATNAIDGDPGTIWHTEWDDAMGPHHITLDLGGDYTVQTLRYLARQTGGTNGMLRDYAVRVSADGQSWGEPVAEGMLAQSTAPQTIELEPAEGRYVRLDFLTSYSDWSNHFASAAELNVQAAPVEEPEEPVVTQRYGFFLNDGWDGKPEHVFQYGRYTDEVLIGDWDGDGRDTITVRRGNRFFVSNAPRGGVADSVFSYGRAGDVVLVGDWNGDGTDTLAVRRGAQYHVKNSLAGGKADHVITYGRAGDVVMVGDWDGNGSDTFAVRRGATYYVKNSMRGGPADRTFTYGRATDVTLAGDWDGNGTDTFAVRRGNEYFVKNSLAGGPADFSVAFGRAGDEVLVGDWNGDGRDTLGVRRTP